MRIIKKILCFALLSVAISSCTLFGLDFQSNEEYEAKSGTNKINQTVWDFIQSRPDIFSTLIDGITYAGIESLYKESGNTHILLTNSALSSGDNCYWSLNKVLPEGRTDSIKATAWEQYDKAEVKELLTYHILKKEWSYDNLSSTVNWVETYGTGKFKYTKDGQTLDGDTAVMDIRLGQDRNLPLQLNNFSWNIRKLLEASAGSCRTTNIKALDGYIHVSDWYQPRPTRFYGSRII